jgi:hypothetical protein
MLVEIPPPRVTPPIEAPRPAGAGCSPCVRLEQAQQPQGQVPRADIVVEIVGNLPLQIKVEEITRLLGRRPMARSFNRIYPPTMLELITLVTRNPAPPRGRGWDSLQALNILYSVETQQITVTYCIDHCGHDPRTGAFDPKRKMVSYSAPEQVVMPKVDKKLGDLQKYAEPDGDE